MTSKFSYLANNIRDAKFLETPFKHITIENFRSDAFSESHKL